MFVVASAGVLYLYLEEKKNVEQEQERQLKAKETVGVGRPKIGGPFSLVDENKVRRTDQDFLGKYTLVYFGFTYCPDICPIELTKMADALNSIGEKRLLLSFLTPLRLSYLHCSQKSYRMARRSSTPSSPFSSPLIPRETR